MSGERSNRVIAADFNARHPTRPPISHATVSKLLAKFRETGSVLDLPICGRMKTVTNEETSVAVLASFSKSPQRSTRRMSLESGISRTSLRWILATHKWHPYKLQLLQHLNEDDPDRHTEFAEWAKQKLEQDPQFTQKILFSDEANFYVNGEVNKQNHRYWSDTNPHWIDPSKTVGTKKLMEEDDAYIPENVTFAPKDVTPIDFTPKDNLHGLGYSGIDPGKALIGGVLEEHIHLFSVESERTSNLLGSEGYSTTRKIGVSGQAFGVGVLEEEDDDIYGTESLSRYDTVIGEEEPGDCMYGWSAPYEYSKKNGNLILFSS
ncbi:GPTC1 protein, partial [Polypterus senegalus]